jgi:hypothetical protein
MIHVARVDIGAAVEQILRSLDRARTVQRRFAVATRACTSEGSRSTSSRSRSNRPRLAAAKTSTTAPRAISGAASSGVQLDSISPNPPAHQALLRLRSAPYEGSKSSIGRFRAVGT